MPRTPDKPDTRRSTRVGDIAATAVIGLLVVLVGSVVWLGWR